MAILQHQATCTVNYGSGLTCGRKDQCTTVRTLDGAGEILNRHDVCGRCRKVMRLPEHDIDLSAAEGETRQLK